MVRSVIRESNRSNTGHFGNSTESVSDSNAAQVEYGGGQGASQCSRQLETYIQWLETEGQNGTNTLHKESGRTENES